VIYGINGSSRVGQRTGKKLDTVLKYLQKTGAQTPPPINLARIRLRFANGDQDSLPRADILKLLRKLESADGVIFATPTYWFNMSGLMKNLMDRLSGVAEDSDRNTGLPKYPLDFKVAAFLAVGDPHEDGAMMAITSMAAVASHLGMVISPYGMLYFRGNDKRKKKVTEMKDFARAFMRTIRATAPYRA
jgi:multimeric flavodoxin WrbA